MAGLPKEVLAACVRAGANPETLRGWKVYEKELYVSIVTVDYQKHVYEFHELYLDEPEPGPAPEQMTDQQPAPEKLPRREPKRSRREKV